MLAGGGCSMLVTEHYERYLTEIFSLFMGVTRSMTSHVQSAGMALVKKRQKNLKFKKYKQM